MREFYLPVSDQPGAERLHSWYWPADAAGAPTLLYLHGVRWNLTAHLRRIENLRSFGFSVVAIDYRGFGQSDGEMPSEEGVYDDAAVAWRWLVAQEPDPKKRFIYGHSLGTAVATELAVAKGAADGMGGLILEGGFTSLPEMAKALAPSWLPIDWLVTQKFATLEKIASVKRPGAAGPRDRRPDGAAPVLGNALRGRAQPKKLVLVEGGSHYNTSWVGAAEYRAAIAELFEVPRRAHERRRRVAAEARPGRDRGAARRSRARKLRAAGSCRRACRRPAVPPRPPEAPPPACGITRPVCCWRRMSAISFIVRSSAVFAAGP